MDCPAPAQPGRSYLPPINGETGAPSLPWSSKEDSPIAEPSKPQFELPVSPSRLRAFGPWSSPATPGSSNVNQWNSSTSGSPCPSPSEPSTSPLFLRPRSPPSLQPSRRSNSSRIPPLSPRPHSSTSVPPCVSCSTSSPPNLDFSLNLLFTSGGASTTPEDIPPAFFPSARIFFAPQLRINPSSALRYSDLGGMHLGVTGMVEILNSKGGIKSQRMICDFTTDLSSGLAIWRKDAVNAMGFETGERVEEGADIVMPAGTYVLPLSLRIPKSNKLPPSFESPQFRIHYTMSLALFSNLTKPNGTPHRLKVYTTPFHVLPSTLPMPPVDLPILTHSHRKGIVASLLSTLSSNSKPDSYHIVIPTLPTTQFSPAAQSCIPISLRIIDRPLEPTDLYIRLALIRRLYVRESSTSSISSAMSDEWGYGTTGLSANALGFPEEVLLERWCKEEVEIVSRWGFIPYSSRPGADPLKKAEVIIRDLALPLSGIGTGWDSGYSTSLDIEPSGIPPTTHGSCSWFSPALRSRPPVAIEYNKHLHVSSRYFLCIEIGFAPPTLQETLSEIGAQSPDLIIPPPAKFTAPQVPSISRFSGASLSNPFPPPPGSNRFRPATSASPISTTSPFVTTNSFPGKTREIFIPITLGSVAEPSMICFSAAEDSTASRLERGDREERGEDMRSEGEGAEGAWRVAPPVYSEALKEVPAYVFSLG